MVWPQTSVAKRLRDVYWLLESPSVLDKKDLMGLCKSINLFIVISCECARICAKGVRCVKLRKRRSKKFQFSVLVGCADLGFDVYWSFQADLLFRAMVEVLCASCKEGNIVAIL